MLEFLSLHLGALKRNQELDCWIEAWLDTEAEVLTPEDWFLKGHDIVGFERDSKGLFDIPIIRSGVYIWSPPP